VALTDRRREQLREANRKYTNANREKRRESWRRYASENRERKIDIARIYRASGKARQASMKWNKSNPGYYAEWYKIHRQDHIERTVHYHREHPEIVAKNYQRRKKAHPEVYAMRNSVGRMLRLSKSARSSRSCKYVGCTSAFLRNHIESLFQIGMTWENWGDWHVDHIVPLSWFPLDRDPSLLFVASHWTNLRPLWGYENRRKGNKVA
jgi:hypothetical protein